MRLRSALILGLLALPSPVLSDPSDCASISDREKRVYCRAVTTGNVAECGSLSDSQARIACRAQVTGSVSECASLRDPDARAFCRARNR
jgi:hypothetical protein